MLFAGHDVRRIIEGFRQMYVARYMTSSKEMRLGVRLDPIKSW